MKHLSEYGNRRLCLTAVTFSSIGYKTVGIFGCSSRFPLGQRQPQSKKVGRRPMPWLVVLFRILALLIVFLLSTNHASTEKMTKFAGEFEKI